MEETTTTQPTEEATTTQPIETTNESIVVPPAPITIDDLLNSTEAILQKEAADKAALEGISEISHDSLKAKLLTWATAGFPNVYELHRVVITPPSLCSDGVSRDLSDYIVFCSGKPISEHVTRLQAKVQGMVISFANMGSYISIVVSKV